MAERVWSEKDLVRRANRRLAVLRHAEEISGSVAVALAPPGAAADWLVSLHGRMDQELDKVRTITRLARMEFPHELVVVSDDARRHEPYQRLVRAKAEFEASRQRIVDIVAQLVDRPDLEQVRTDLSVLEHELPALSDPDDQPRGW
jgi:hypothetical protein